MNKLTSADFFSGINFSVRAFNCLKRGGCFSIEDILKLTPEGLGKMRNIGFKAHDEVILKMQEAGYEMKDFKLRGGNENG